MKISVNYLGIPEVLADGKVISFPFKKAEMIFYYIVLEKKVSREKLVELFWPEADELAAKKNLRNAVYVIKKLLGNELFISAKRHVIQLNTSIIVEIDLEAFVDKVDEEAILYYRGEFLEGIHIKDADSVENWLFQKRQEYHEMYLSKLNQLTKISLDAKAYQQAESYGKKLVSQDLLNEESYRLLMAVFLQQKKINQSIAVYEELKLVLERELSVSPDDETKELFDQILCLKRNTGKGIKTSDIGFGDIFYGREQQLQIMDSNHQRFLNNEGAQSILITGEAGIGKSKLIEEFIKKTNRNTCSWILSYCYKPEENDYYKPWMPVISKIVSVAERLQIDIPMQTIEILEGVFPELTRMKKKSYETKEYRRYRDQMIENQILQLIKTIAEKSRLFIIFEDIQWMDEKSRSLLHYVLINTGYDFYMITSLRYESAYEDHSCFDQLQIKGVLKKIALEPFSEEKTIDFSKKLWKRADFPKNLEEAVYPETQGNTFFIKELLNCYMKTSEQRMGNIPMENAIKSRFLDLTEEEIKIVNMASLFFDKISIENLKQLTGKDDLELIDLLVNLQQKNILKEIVGFNEAPFESKFIFTHQKVREYVYSHIPVFKRKVLHLKIAKMLEQRMENQHNPIVLYTKLMHHYKNASDEVNFLHYKIKNVEKHLDFNHEMFPILKHEGDSINLSWDRERVTVELKQVHKLLVEIRKKNPVRVYEEMEVKYLNILSRFQILQGNHEKGMAINRNMIEKSEKINNPETMLQGYKHAIYYCINIRRPEEMRRCIHKAFQVLRNNEFLNVKEETAIFFRLKGKMKIMTGNYHEAEGYFKKALKLFISADHIHPYILNIAACYSFLGECRRLVGDLEGAMTHYRKAVIICEKKKLKKGLSVFYVHLGKLYFDTNQWNEAEKCFCKYIEYYKHSDCLWKKSIPYGCMAVILLKKDRKMEALQYFKEASVCVERFQNPYEIGTHYRICWMIAKKMREDKGLKKTFKGVLSKDPDFYLQGIRENADKTSSDYELNQSLDSPSTLY